ncbi:MAG: hypothetical protein EBX52_13730, partial [Proteobacteria bacterium]|nr:hypothetical protein [Pseudomonadota bacterium]
MTMKNWFSVWVLFGIGGLSACGREDLADPPETPVYVQDLKDRLLARILVAGASQSADTNTESPAKVLARRVGTFDALKVAAFPGKKGSYTVPRIPEADFRDASLIIGHDLFFWDSISLSCDESLKTLEDFVAKARELQVPVIIGNIPRIRKLPIQPCRKQMNERLEAICRDGCQLYDLNALYER